MANENESTAPHDEGVPDLTTPVGQAAVVTLPLDRGNGYGDAELDALERFEEMGIEAEPAMESAPAADAALSELEARTERLTEIVRAQQASRVHRKVTAAVAGGGVVGAIPAVLAAVDALELPADLQPFVVLAAALLGLFTAAYSTPEREAPEI